MINEETIREAFKKVKEDMDFLKEEITNLKQRLLDAQQAKLLELKKEPEKKIDDEIDELY